MSWGRLTNLRKYIPILKGTLVEKTKLGHIIGSNQVEVFQNLHNVIDIPGFVGRFSIFLLHLRSRNCKHSKVMLLTKTDGFGSSCPKHFIQLRTRWLQVAIINSYISGKSHIIEDPGCSSLTRIDLGECPNKKLKNRTIPFFPRAPAKGSS